MNGNHARELRQLLSRLRANGWHIAISRRGHYQCYGPDGQLVFCPSTPSDHRSLANMRGKLRRAGAQL